MEADTIKRKTKQGHKDIALPKKFVPRFWADSDSRISIVKAIKRRVQLLREHAGGGESVQRDLLCQRIAFLSILIESQEVAAVSGGAFDSGSFVQSVNALLGLLKTVGLDKRIRNVGDLKTYLDERRNGKRK